MNFKKNIKSLITALFLILIPMHQTFACSSSVGEKVYMLLGRNDSSLRIYDGYVLIAGKDTSKVEMSYCHPTCTKWVNNCAFFSSKQDAEKVRNNLDSNHTSFLEGLAIIGGALIIQGLTSDTPKEKQTIKVDPYSAQTSEFDDTQLQEID